MRKRKIKQISLGVLISLIVSIPIFISSNTYAVGPLQTVADENGARTIFAAACATCHGAKGTGGVTWIKNSPTDIHIAPPLVGLSASSIYSRVRQGAPSNGMPAFGPEIITDAELNVLANMIADSPQSGVAPPAKPAGTEIRVDILDADPWYADDGTDGDPDYRRVELTTSNAYLKIYNTGRTWHTLTNPGPSLPKKDSGFIGYAGNYDGRPEIGETSEDAGDGGLPGNLGDMGYYYADQISGLTPGCTRYLCRMHPYMQMEVCTNGNSPQQPNEYAAVLSGGSIGMTRAHKNASFTPSFFGIGEVWVTTQSQEEFSEVTDNVVDNSVVDDDGTYQVIDTASWTIPSPNNLILDVGNNPHNSWPGKNDAGLDVVLSANWHDNTVTLMDATTVGGVLTNPLPILKSKGHSGATNAHIMVSPADPTKFFVTHMGGNVLQEIDVDAFDHPNGDYRIRGATGPHGLWMCDDGKHVLTANTFGGSATLYNVSGLKGNGTSTTAPSLGAAPLAPSIMSGFQGGCSRGFTNNALTADVSIYDITLADPDDDESQDKIEHATGWSASDGGGLPLNVGDNIRLRNIDGAYPGQGGLGLGSYVARWANLPIQTPVSPGDSTTHKQFVVTANKASFNVSITGLKASDGLPWGLFTIPAGLGAHGVTYGPKSMCDALPVVGNAVGDGVEDTAFNPAPGGSPKCYYAYVSNTFEDYVSVYDLEKIDVNDNFADDNLEIIGDGIGDDVQPCGTLEDCEGMDIVGSALIAENAYVEGGAIAAVAALDPVVAGTCDVADLCDCGNDHICPWSPDWVPVPPEASEGDGTYETLVYDLPGGTDPGTVGNGIPGNTACVGAFTLAALGVSVESDAAIGDYDPVITDGLNNVLYCGIGAMNTAPLTIGTELLADGSTIPSGVVLYAANVPIGVLCPDCRDGVHAGDVNLLIGDGLGANGVGGAPLAGPPTAVLGITFGPDPNGALSNYTYVKDDVYVDTETTVCAVQLLSGIPFGVLNNCDGSTILRGGGADFAGTLNAAVPMDLDLGINSGGQGITGVPAAFPW